jgi:CMP-N,N'-diacetyllegionaminic acid synthase
VARDPLGAERPCATLSQMGDARRILGVITARGGSKGIPGKNIRLLAGRPLLEYTVRAAEASGALDRVILSTDSDDIAAVGHRLGVEVPFVRPAELAQDETPTVDVLEHAVEALEREGWSPMMIVLLQPTAPLRRPRHIVDAVALLSTCGGDSVASVVQVPQHFSPDYVMRIESDGLVPFLPEGARLTRRQDARTAYSRDGTVYAVWRDILMERHSIYGNKCCPLVIDAAESLNLDTLEDWAAAERAIYEAIP